MKKSNYASNLLNMKSIKYFAFFMALGINQYLLAQTTYKSIPYIANKNHENSRMRFKVVASKVQTFEKQLLPFKNDLLGFSEENYQKIHEIVANKNIPELQKAVKNKQLTYYKLTLYFLKRIEKYELDSTKSLHNIISLNPKALFEAKKFDKLIAKGFNNIGIMGMPILLKDNIGYEPLPTTAGAAILKDNKAKNATITQQLLKNKAIILGKTNLSEWAYFLCIGCPLGYSAVGGQTMNPHGRMIFESGGSSSGSGSSIAANFAVAAVGTETSGSILSPSSLNSLFGLKPTVGLLSRNGIVPISSTLDTPGPMTKNLTDNLLLLKALLGKDPADSRTSESPYINFDLEKLQSETLKGKRLGVQKTIIENPIMAQKLKLLQQAGAEIVELEDPKLSLPGYRTLLSYDMKNDLAAYLKQHSSKNINAKNVLNVIDFNKQNISLYAPYGQELFEGIVADDSTKQEDFEKIKNTLLKIGKDYFVDAFVNKKIDAFVSINNNHAAYAAMAFYPALAIPMGLDSKNQPIGLTLIAQSWQEEKLYGLGFQLEKILNGHIVPQNYKD